MGQWLILQQLSVKDSHGNVLYTLIHGEIWTHNQHLLPVFNYPFAFLFLISGHTVAVGSNNEDGWRFLMGLAIAIMGHRRGRYSMSKDGREPERDELQAGQFGGGAAFGL